MEIWEGESIHTFVPTNGTQPDAAAPSEWQLLQFLIGRLAQQSEEIGRLRAERNALAAERDRMIVWIETDRALTERLLAALESELATLRASIEREPTPELQLSENGVAALLEPASLPTEQPGPVRSFGIGHRRRQGISPSFD